VHRGCLALSINAQTPIILGESLPEPRTRTGPRKVRKRAPSTTKRAPDTRTDTHLLLSPRATSIVLEAMREYKRESHANHNDRDRRIIDAVISELIT
jgi:hypothetical protein